MNWIKPVHDHGYFIWESQNRNWRSNHNWSWPGSVLWRPPVTGLVFSYNGAATRYAALTEIHQPHIEIVDLWRPPVTGIHQPHIKIIDLSPQDMQP